MRWRLTWGAALRSLKNGHFVAALTKINASKPGGGSLREQTLEELMIKYIVAIALIMPVLTVSSTAQQYQGGPKSSFAPVRQIGGDIYAQ